MKLPPQLLEKLLCYFIKDELLEEVLGDLHEKFLSESEKKGYKKAKLNYWYQVINYLRPFALKHFKINSKKGTMIKHNLLVGFRVLLKNKTFSAINIGGLAIGMTVAILIGLWINDELSFDRHHDNHDRIVQVLRKDIEEGEVEINSSMVSKLGTYLEETYPTLFKRVGTTFYRNQEQILTVGKQSFSKMCYFFSPDAPEMLTLDMVAGTREGLENPDGILLSQSLAKALFFEKNPVGEIVQINTSTNLIVRGVYRDIPLNSTFRDMEFMVSMDLVYNEKNPATWDNYNTKIYAQLNEGIDVAEASDLIKNALNTNISEEEGYMDLLLHPMKDWHLNSNFVDGVQKTSSSMQFIRLYGAIGLFVLLLACINFMNLNTSRYQNRAKEIGIRKTMGSVRMQLMSQFFLESVLYAFVAFIISVFLATLSIPWFNAISDKAVGIPWLSGSFWLVGLGIMLFTGIVAGSYPAIFLSSFGPIRALKGTMKQGRGSVRFRQVLVVFQFVISIVLIIGTITIYNQIQHAKSRPVGYNQEGLITIRGRSGDYFRKYDVLREELKRTGYVKEIGAANYPLTTTLGNNDGFRLQGEDNEYQISFNTIYVTPEYGATTEWKLLEGREFSRERGDESGSIILSKSAIEEMDLEDPIGKVIQARRDFNGKRDFEIIGVVEDMIKGSPYAPPRPLMLFSVDVSPFLFIRIKSESNYIKAIPAIQEAFQKVLPGHPFHYEFVDNTYSKKFVEEERVSSLATLFSVLAILISCLGVFGLSAFVVEQRTKEIGIRKVLGASVSNLWQLLSKDFTLLVIFACVIAVPIAMYFLNQWLNSFEYRIQLSWWIFTLSGLIAFIVAVGTVSIHSMRAALANPADSLRTE